MSGERFTTPVWTALDINGDPLPGAKLYFYTDGTTNPKSTYSDVDLTTANSNPVEADAAGRFTTDIFLANSTYRVKLTDSSDEQIWQKDDVNNIVLNTTTGVLPFPGMIVPFFGTQVQLDVWLGASWFVCDGNNGTPNLDEKYIKGTTNIAGVGITGGANLLTTTGTVVDHTLTVDELPSHDHGAGTNSVDTAPRTGGGGILVGSTPGTPYPGEAVGGGQPHDHSLTMDQHNNEPAYYQLIWLYYGGS